MAASKIFGIVRIRVDGELMESLPGAQLELGGMVRKPVTGHAFYGWTEEYKTAEIKFKIPLKASTPVSKINDLTEATITFETDVGLTWMVANGVNQNPLNPQDGGKGEIDVTLFGDAAQEQ